MIVSVQMRKVSVSFLMSFRYLRRSRSAAELADLPPWEALSTWLHRFVGYAATKRALHSELMATMDRDADVFAASRAAITGAGEMLLARAQRKPVLVHTRR